MPLSVMMYCSPVAVVVVVVDDVGVVGVAHAVGIFAAVDYVFFRFCCYWRCQCYRKLLVLFLSNSPPTSCPRSQCANTSANNDQQTEA